MVRRTLRVVISLILTVFLLFLFFRNVDFREVGRSLAEARLLVLVGAILMALFSYWLRTIRWQRILRPVGRTRHSSALLATVVGYAGITLLPARLGDLARPLLLSKRDAIPTSATLASIVTERVIDLWTVMLFFFIFLIAPPPMPALSQEGAGHLGLLRLSGWIVGGGLVVGTGILLCLFRYQERFIERFTAPVRRFRPSWHTPIVNFLKHFLDGLRVMQRPRDFFWVMLISVVIWGTIVLQLMLTLAAFDIHLPVQSAFALILMTVIGLLVPTPGGVGSFHAMFQLGLTTFFGIDHNLAAGVALTYHAVCFYPIAVIGLACIPIFGLSFFPARIVEDEA